MASFEVKGTIVHVGKTEQVSDSFRKRSIIMEIDKDTEYPQTIQFEAAQAKCEDNFLDEARAGDEATVHFNLRGRVYDNKEKKIKQVFNQLAFWKGSLSKTTPAAASNEAYGFGSPAPVDTTQEDESRDLPF